MTGFLPLHQAIRNLGRRPLRSLLMLLAGALVSSLFVATSAFVRSLEASHLGNAPEDTAILLSTAADGDIVRSAMSPAVADLVAADVPSIVQVGVVPAASPEIHMGTEIRVTGDGRPRQAFVRGVTERAFLVHGGLSVVEGALPGPGEALVGRLAAAKSDLDPEQLAIGQELQIEGGSFVVSGIFAAPGTTVESEIWVPMSELQGHSQRDDCSVVFVRVGRREDLSDVDLFAKRRLDLEILSVPTDRYYAEMAAYFDPILGLAWSMAILIGIAAATGGANTVVAAVQDRVRELGTLRAIGFRGGAVVLSVLQENLVIGMAGALLGLLLARLMLAQASVSMAMTAFSVDVDPVSALVGLVGMLVISVLSAVPALMRILRLPIAVALKES